MTKPEILTWTCKNCGKIINSLFETQLEHNKAAHQKSCNDGGDPK